MFEKYFNSTVGVKDGVQRLPEDCDKASILAHMLNKGQAFARPLDDKTYLYKIVSENDYDYQWWIIARLFLEVN